jgi:hypothetical protein
MEVRGARGEFSMNRLSEADFAFRESIMERRSIGEAAECAFEADAAFDPGMALAVVITGELITGIKSRATETEQ